MRVLNTWTGEYPIGFHLNGTWESCRHACGILTDEFFLSLHEKSTNNPQTLEDVTILYMWYDPHSWHGRDINSDTYVMQDHWVAGQVVAKQLLLGSLETWKVPGTNICDGWDWTKHEKPVAMKPHLLVKHLLARS